MDALRPIRHRLERPPIRHEAATSAKDGAMLLHTEGLKKVYDGRAVVNGVDIEVKAARSSGSSARTAPARPPPST